MYTESASYRCTGPWALTQGTMCECIYDVHGWFPLSLRFIVEDAQASLLNFHV